MTISAEVRYILTGGNTIITDHYFCYFRKADIDVDAIYDNWERTRTNKSFYELVDELFWKWYNTTSDWNRSYTFYYFAHDFGWNFNSRVRDAVENDGYISIIGLEHLDSYICKYLNLFNKLSRRVYNTFNEIIIGEYKGRTSRWGGSLSEMFTDSALNTITTTQTTGTYQSNNIDTYINRTHNGSIQPSYTVYGNNHVYNTGNQVIVNNSVTGASRVVNINCSSTQTTTVNIINSQVLEALQKFKKKKVDQAKLKKERVHLRKVIKKSFGILQRFIGLDKVKRFLNGEGFIIEANRFNYRLALPHHSNLISGSKNLNAFSISYDLEILNKKDNSRICKACVVFKGSPILDQVLSAYMFLVGGEEDALLKNCGFFSKSDDFYDHFPEEKSEDSYLFRQPELLRELNSAVTEVVGTTCNVQRNALPDLNRESINFARRSVNLERLRKKYRTKMDQELSYAIAEYLFTTDVSWGEAIDYAAFNLFNVKVFDKFVKDSKCQWQQERAAINNKIKKLGIFDATKSRKSKQSRNKFRQYLRGENTEWSDNISELLWRSYDRVGRKGLPGDRRKDSRTPSERTPILYS